MASSQPSASDLLEVNPEVLPAGQLRRNLLKERSELGVLLGATAVLYLWVLDRSGWANPYYSAAVQAGTQSWKAFFFGSLDSGNALTVDKTPLALWPMELAARVFGFSPWSVLVPQALAGVLAVWLLAAATRHTTGSARTGLLAGALFALTPVATLMFRYNNPDALLTLLLVGAAYATIRSLDSPRALPWLVLAGSIVGMGFLTKMLEALLVVPGLALTYLLFAQAPLWRRWGHLAASLTALLFCAGWWVAVVELWPAGARPYIGGSSTNSVIELALGYNGIARLVGSNSVSDAGGSAVAASNLARISRTDLGAEIVWLLPAALVLGLVALRLSRRPDDPSRSALTGGLFLWFIWLVVIGSTFAAMSGVFHSYYVIVMAPATAALTAIGGCLVWQQRDRHRVRLTLVVVSVSTTLLSIGILLVVGAGVRWALVPVAVIGTIAAFRLYRHRPDHAGAIITAGCLVVAAALGPTAVSVSTAAHAHSGNNPMAGPDGRSSSSRLAFPGTAVTGFAPESHYVSDEMASLLRAGSARYTWSAATFGARAAASYELTSGTAVIAIGGYKGTDPSPTLATFQGWVRDGRIHYLLAEGTTGAASVQIGRWVADHFPKLMSADTTYYDLGGGAASIAARPDRVSASQTSAQVPGRFPQ